MECRFHFISSADEMDIALSAVCVLHLCLTVIYPAHVYRVTVRTAIPVIWQNQGREHYLPVMPLLGP